MKKNSIPAAAPDRSVQPAIHIPRRVDMPAARQTASAGGIPLYTLESGDIEVIRLSLVFRAGNSYQPQPFVASAALSMLNEGTARYTAAEIAEKFDFYGSQYDVNIDRDYAMVTICALSRYFEETLDLLEEILLHPLFPEYELGVYSGKRKQRLQVERTKVGYRARELFAAALFGKTHPYGIFSDPSEYDKLDRTLLEDFYKRHYTAGHCFAVASGYVTPQHSARIAALLDKIPSRPGVGEPSFAAPVSTPYTYAEMEGSVQSAIRIGRLMFPRTHPDFIGMQVTTTLLGGYFGSRLVANLREDKGYTYGIFAGMINMERAGYMAIATEVGAEVTEAAIEEIFKEIDRMREEIVSSEELEIVKSTITGELMRILDGPFGIADITIENHQNGTDNGYINRFIDEVNAITPERIHALARQYFTREDFITVIAGMKTP